MGRYSSSWGQALINIWSLYFTPTQFNVSIFIYWVLKHACDILQSLVTHFGIPKTHQAEYYECETSNLQGKSTGPWSNALKNKIFDCVDDPFSACMRQIWWERLQIQRKGKAYSWAILMLVSSSSFESRSVISLLSEASTLARFSAGDTGRVLTSQSGKSSGLSACTDFDLDFALVLGACGVPVSLGNSEKKSWNMLTHH